MAFYNAMDKGHKRQFYFINEYLENSVEILEGNKTPELIL